MSEEKPHPERLTVFFDDESRALWLFAYGYSIPQIAKAYKKTPSNIWGKILKAAKVRTPWLHERIKDQWGEDAAAIIRESKFRIRAACIDYEEDPE